MPEIAWPSYQALDRIADACNPALGAAWLLLVVAAWWQRRWREAAARFALGLACLLLAYGLMWLDAALALWARIGLDYSTHTSVAVALAATIAGIAPRAWPALLAGLLGYALLMLRQRYHAPADIASTAAVVASMLAGVVAWFRRVRPASSERAGRRLAT